MTPNPSPSTRCLIRVGCCGFPISRRKYFGVLNTVELQQTFYQPPEVSTAMRWHDDAPPTFKYTLKAWQLITHEPKSPTYRRLRVKIPQSKEKNYGSFKPTDEVLSAWEKTREIADVLHASIVIFQCPPSFEPTSENKLNLRRFFSSIDRGNYTLAWEPRGKWRDEEISSICKDLDLVHTVDPFKSMPTWGKIRYYRLHGIGGYKYKYTKDDLNTLSELTKEGIDSYFMFNNTSMYEDALAFQKLIAHPI